MGTPPCLGFGHGWGGSVVILIEARGGPWAYKNMKKAMILAALCATVGAAFAQKTPAKPAPAKTKPGMTACAVMPKDVISIADAEKAGHYSDYKGKRYYFCCPGCKPSFDKNPAKYAATAKGYPIPTKKGDKKA